MTTHLPPIVMSCGEPAGVGPELAVAARRVLGRDVPFFLLGDPTHLPKGAPFSLISSPLHALDVAGDVLPVLAHPFAAPARPGQPDPANAAGVIEVIARGGKLVAIAAHAAEMIDLPSACVGRITRELKAP